MENKNKQEHVARASERHSSPSPSMASNDPFTSTEHVTIQKEKHDVNATKNVPNMCMSTNQNMVYYVPQSDPHPKWFCKREGCDGVLTAIGNVRCYLDDIDKARRRAEIQRKKFPQTYIHGGPLSCSKCGTWFGSIEICTKPRKRSRGKRLLSLSHPSFFFLTT